VHGGFAMDYPNIDKISYHYVHPTAAVTFAGEHFMSITIFGDADAVSLRTLILDIHKKNPTMQHYVEARESDSQIIELLRAEKFGEGEAFLHLNTPAMGWLGYVIDPHIVNSW